MNRTSAVPVEFHHD